MSVAAFTQVHVILSLAGIFDGLIVVIGMFRSKNLHGWNAAFLALTVLTSATGYFFPRDHILPSHIVGAISLVLLATAIYARYARRLAGSWRWIYVVCAVLALYLNISVAVIQAFLKVPSLTALAPTQSEPPFLAAQAVLMLIVIAAMVVAIRSFRPKPATA
jgi:hypothetical protein